jgi:hypothetical protein
VGLHRLPVVLLGALLVARPAGAAVVGVARTDPHEITGLSLAGDAVVWGDVSAYRLGRQQTWTVRLARAGERPRIRFAAKMRPFEGPLLAASATHLALMPSHSVGSGVAWRLLAGPLEGPLAPLNDSLRTRGELEWSGGLLAASEDSQGSAEITVRDAASGFSPRVLSRDGNVSALRVAGGRIALATPVFVPGDQFETPHVRIDVRRVDDGRLEYSVTAEPAARFDFDLQEDGKVAWLQGGTHRGDGTSQGGALYWASPAEPSPHALASGVAGGTLRVRLAGDRVAFGRIVGGWRRQPIFQPWLTDLAGVARPVWFPLPGPAFSDFDGSRLAVAAGGCVWMGDVADRRSGPPGGTCPQRVTGVGERRISRGGSRYGYGIHCLMAPPAGCRGRARLEVAKREFGARKVVTVRRFRAGRGKATQVRFRVSRSRLRRLRNRAGSVWLFVSVRSTDSAGLTSITDSLAFAAQP